MVRRFLQKALLFFIILSTTFSSVPASLFEEGARVYVDNRNVVDKIWRVSQDVNVVDRFIPFQRIVDKLKVSTAFALASGDGKIFYSISANTTPRTRDYASSTNTFAAAASTVVGGTALQSSLKSSPTKDEMVAGYVNSSGTLQVMCWSGSAWTNEWTVALGGTGTTRRFDIAYETATGDAIVLYSTNAATTNELAYRTKLGSAACGTANWSAATNLDPVRTTAAVGWVKLAHDRRAAQNLITAIWADGNADLSAMVWSGTAWGNEPSAVTEASLEVVTAAQDVEDFDVEYESSSGDVMVVWANSAGANGTNGVRYRVCTGGTSTCTWGAVTTPPTWIDDATNLDISANPNTDEMVFASIGNAGSDMQLGYWSGSAWTNTANVDAASATPLAGTNFVATGWLISGATTRSVVAYYDSAATNIGWYVGNVGVFTAQTDFAVSPVFGVQKNYSIKTDPINKDRLMFTVNDANSDIHAKRLVMTSTPAFTWTNSTGGAPIEANTASATYKTFDFEYNRYIPAVTTTLATGSDPAAATIAPSATATNVNTFTLQTSSGTETVTSVTVNLSTANGVGVLAISNGANFIGSTNAPVTGSNTISVSGLTADTTLRTFSVWVTPLSHALQPAVPGASYSITAPVTAWAGANTHTGSDTNSNALTIDNLSPSGATLASGTAGNAQVTLNWTTSASADFSRSVVLRWAASTPGIAVPAEGTDYANGNTVGGGSKIDYGTGQGPLDVAFDSSTNSIWVTNYLDGVGNTVSKFTAATGALVETYTVGTAPRGVAFDSSTNSVWVVNNGGPTVTKLAAATGALVGTYSTGAGPVDVAFDSSTNSIWVTNGSGTTVTKLAAATGALVGTYTVGNNPQGVAFDSSTNSIWVANNGGALGNTVTKLTAATGALVGTYTTGTGPYGVAFDSSTNSIWIANQDGALGNTVTKLTAATGALVGTYTTGAGPLDVAFDSSTNSIWVTNGDGGTGVTVSKLTAATGAYVGTYTTGNNPFGITFDSSTNSIWVTNYVDNTVSKIDAVDATVVCVRTADAVSTAITDINGAGGTGCLTTALTNGTVYSYKVFQKDANGNYDAGVVPTGSPFTPAAPSVTTLADGTNPSNATIAPSAAITDLDAFTLTTSAGTDAATAVTVTLTPAGAFNNIAQVDITDNSNLARCTAITNPASNTISFSTCSSNGGVAVTTSATTYKVRITPKTHANMSAVPGASYAVTGTVTAFTSTNTQAGSDAGSATVTLDNLSPAGATATSGTAGNAQVTLNWTTSATADFGRSVVLRWTGASAGAEVPVEGTDYSNGNTIATATIVCVRTADGASTAVSDINGAGATSCSSTALTNGQAYTYKVFQKDANGNYDAGVSIGTFTPSAGGALPVSGTLTSSVFDTASADGATFNSILWNGTTIGTGAVRFQFAASNSSTGPWDYYGAGSGTCNAGDWFNPGALDTAVELKGSGCAALWNNKRYYRYKVQICSAANCTDTGATSPVINKIVVSWSP